MAMMSNAVPVLIYPPRLWMASGHMAGQTRELAKPSRAMNNTVKGIVKITFEKVIRSMNGMLS
jgi:hypothetical protein